MSARVTREDREAAVACEYGVTWRTWMRGARKIDIDAWIEGAPSGFGRVTEAQIIADHRERSTAALREAAERLLCSVESDAVFPEMRVSGHTLKCRDALRSLLRGDAPKGGDHG